ncbi:MAG: pyridoxal-phosphate dependent enzyme, partial [Acidobacteriales bacterium]|nr:pyridoxal-phosphate dependent enzyme [Terriglobales bacterium]
MSNVTYLECTKCGAHLPADIPQNVCSKDGGILFARYDLQTLKKNFNPDSLKGRAANLWRYPEVLPGLAPITLGEGFTPLLPSREFPNVWIKDEGLNPTGSFKARGITVAISVAKALGLKKLAMP